MATQYLDTDVYGGSRYTPETFQERALVPMALRERHDSADALIDTQLQSINDLKIHEKMRDGYVSSKTEELNNKLNDLANNFYNTGSGNMGNINSFKNLKRNLDKELSLTGGLGARANATKQYDIQRELLVQDAVKRGHDPNRMLEWINRDFDKYLEENISTEDGRIINQYLPDFVSTAAPNKFDTLDWMTKSGNLAKYTSVLDSDVKMKPTIAPDGSIMMTTTTTQSLTEDNKRQMDEVLKALNYQINNPESDMYRNKKFNLGPDATHEDIKEALRQEVIPLLEAQRYSKNTTQTNTDVKQIKGGGTGNTDKEPKDDRDVAASLMKSDTALPPGEIATYTQTRKAILDLERKEELGTATQEDAIKKQQFLALSEKLADIENSPEGIDRIDAAIKEKFSNFPDRKYRHLRGINSLEELNSTIENTEKDLESEILSNFNGTREEYINQKELEFRDMYPEGKIDYINDDFPVRIFEGGAYGSTAYSSASSSDKIQESLTLQRVKEEVYQDTFANQQLLYSKDLRLGTGEASNKIRKNIEPAINDLDMVRGLLTNNGGKLYHHSKHGTDIIDVNGKPILFSTTFGERDNQVSFQSITDAGITGESSINLKVESKKGNDVQEYTIRLGLNKENLSNDIYNNILQDIYTGLDDSGKADLDRIMINMENADVAVDGIDFFDRGASVSDLQNSILKGKSENVINGASVRQSYSTQEVNRIDYFNDPNYRNVIVRLSDEFFMHVQSGEDGNRAIKAGQWFERDNMINYSMENLNYKYSKNAIPNLETASIAELREFIFKVSDLAIKITDTDPTIKIGNSLADSERIKNEVSVYLDKNNELKKPTNISLEDLNAYGGTTDRRDAVLQASLALELFRSMEDQTIAFKNLTRHFRPDSKYFSDSKQKVNIY